MLMWLCQMMCAEVILGVPVDWLTIPRIGIDLGASRQSRAIPNFVLARNLANQSHWRGNLQQIL
jgi:hypothetical protein